MLTLKERKSIARRVAFRVWGDTRSTTRLGKARRVIESLLEDGFRDRHLEDMAVGKIREEDAHAIS